MVLSALIGGRAHPVFESDQGPRCLSPVTVAEEMAEHLPGIAVKAKIDPDLALLALRAMPVRRRRSASVSAILTTGRW